MPKGILNKASLVMVPEAPIDGTMPSVFPEDRSGDFTFTRGSNLAATRVASNGLIEKGRENLLLQSNQFDTTPWNRNLVTATSGQSGYDGNTNAWKIDLTGAAGNLAVGGLSAGNVGTYSVYAKAGTLNWILLGSQSGNIQAYINLSDGSIGTTGALVIEAKTEDVGGGWYRCSMTYSGTATVARVYPAQANGNLTATSGNILIQDSQLEIGLAATEVISTGATTGKAGLLENEPRIDFTGGGCGALLLEPQRTNAYISSEWILNLDADLSQEISDIDGPIENTPFLKITKNTSGLSRQLLYTSTNGDIDTCSVFAKKGSAGGNQIYFADSFYGSATMSASFDLDTGSWFVPPSGTALADYGFDDFGNGMYRIWVAGRTMDFANPDSTRWRNPALFFDNGQLSVGEHIYITGLQTERNSSYPTSYIPTYGSSVTRSAEICSLSSASSIIGQTEGVIYAEVELTEGYDSNQIFFNLSDATFANQMFFQRYNGSLGYKILSGGTTQAENYPITSGTTHKVALLYSEDNIKMFANGSRVSLDTSASIPATNKINLSSYWNGLLQFGGGIKKAVLFPTALTDEECSALTQP